MSILSGNGSSGVFSIATSFLATKQSAFRLLMKETIPRHAQLSFHTSKQFAPNVAISLGILQFTVKLLELDNKGGRTLITFLDVVLQHNRLECLQMVEMEFGMLSMS
jgi:hypothetical protein